MEWSATGRSGVSLAQLGGGGYAAAALPRAASRCRDIDIVRMYSIVTFEQTAANDWSVVGAIVGEEALHWHSLARYFDMSVCYNHVAEYTMRMHHTQRPRGFYSDWRRREKQMTGMM